MQIDRRLFIHFDWTLLGIVLAIALIGILNLYSATAKIEMSGTPQLGGRLVYATCSLLPVENEAIVESFLAEHAEFRLAPANEILKASRIGLDTGEYLRLDPASHGTDGFFAAVLEKTR